MFAYCTSLLIIPASRKFSTLFLMDSFYQWKYFQCKASTINLVKEWRDYGVIQIESVILYNNFTILRRLSIFSQNRGSPDYKNIISLPNKSVGAQIRCYHLILQDGLFFTCSNIIRIIYILFYGMGPNAMNLHNDWCLTVTLDWSKHKTSICKRSKSRLS